MINKKEVNLFKRKISEYRKNNLLVRTNVIPDFFLDYDNADEEGLEHLKDVATFLDDSSHSPLNYKGREVYRVLGNVPNVFDSTAKDSETMVEFKNFKIIIFERADFEEGIVDDFISTQGEIIIWTKALSSKKIISAKKKKDIQDYIASHLHEDFSSLKIDISDWGEVGFTLDDSYLDLDSQSIINVISHGLDTYDWDIHEYQLPSNSLDFIMEE
jgi:hypothetical protein